MLPQIIITKKYIYILKNYTPFTNFITKINNTQIDNANDIDIVMRMYNLIELLIIFQKHLEAYGNIVIIH